MLVRASEVVSVERRCSRGVQLTVDVLGAAGHAAEAWEAAVSARRVLRLWLFTLSVVSCWLAVEPSRAILVRASEAVSVVILRLNYFGNGEFKIRKN